MLEGRPRTFNHKILRRFVGGFAWPTLMLAIFTWIIFLLNLYALAKGIIPKSGAVCVAVICNFYSFTVLHEAVHENIEGLKRGGWITEVLGWVSGLMFLAPFRIFRLIHLTHHQHTNKPGLDPDHWVASQYFLGSVARCLTIYLNYFFTYVFKLGKSPKELVPDFAIIICYWLVPFWALTTDFHDVALYGIMIPTILGTGVQAFLFDWLPHHPHQETSQALNTRNFPSLVLHVLMAGQNVHQLHHVNPRIPFHRYHAAFKAGVVPLQEHGTSTR